MKKTVILFGSLVICILAFAGCKCEHEWTDADCENPEICELCDATGDPALGHDWIEADCENPQVCEVCDETGEDALGHDWIDATCTEPKTCSRCGETKGDPLDHKVTDWNTVTESTCSQKGLAEGKCVRCDQTQEQKLDKLPHTEGEWTILKEATISQKGLKQTKCTVCEEILDEEEFELSAEERETQYKAQCQKFSYNTIARNPDGYKGEMGYVYGRVIQVMEDGNDYTLRVAMNGSYSQVILVSYTKPPKAARILEDDYVKMYGIWSGTYTYEAVSGASITIPLFLCEYLDIQ